MDKLISSGGFQCTPQAPRQHSNHPVLESRLTEKPLQVRVFFEFRRSRGEKTYHHPKQSLFHDKFNLTTYLQSYHPFHFQGKFQLMHHLTPSQSASPYYHPWTSINPHSMALFLNVSRSLVLLGIRLTKWQLEMQIGTDIGQMSI